MSEKLVTVMKYMTPAEAHVVKNRLEAEGIPVYLADEETVGVLWYCGSALGGVKVQVVEEHADRAAAVLEQPADDVAPDALAEPVEESESCAEEENRLRPQAGGIEDDLSESPGDALALRAYRAAIFGVLILPPLLHLYSLWVLLRLAQSEHETGPRTYWMPPVAFLIDLLVLLLAYLFITRVFLW